MDDKFLIADFLRILKNLFPIFNQLTLSFQEMFLACIKEYIL